MMMLLVVEMMMKIKMMMLVVVEMMMVTETNVVLDVELCFMMRQELNDGCVT